MTLESVIPPTRFAIARRVRRASFRTPLWRTTLPARGRDVNGVIQNLLRAFVQGEIYDGLPIADAIQSLPLTGRVARLSRAGWGDDK